MTLIAPDDGTGHCPTCRQPTTLFPAVSDEPSQEVVLNGRTVTLSGIALEVMRTLEAEHHAANKAAFNRGYIGGRKFDVPALRRVKFLISQAQPNPSLVEAVSQIDVVLKLTEEIVERISATPVSDTGGAGA